MSDFYKTALFAVLKFVQERDFELYREIMREGFDISVRRLWPEEIEQRNTMLRVAKESGDDIRVKFTLTPETAALLNKVDSTHKKGKKRR